MRRTFLLADLALEETQLARLPQPQQGRQRRQQHPSDGQLGVQQEEYEEPVRTRQETDARTPV